MNKALAAAVLVLVSQIAAAEAQTKWTKFQPPGAGFSIEFPGTPVVKKDTMPSQAGPAPHFEAKLTYAHADYSVDLVTYASASPPEAVLDLFANGFAEKEHVRSQTRLKVGADPARRLEIEMQQNQIVSTILLVTDGTRVYWAVCVTSNGKEHSADVSHFINSFVLVPQ